MFMGFIIGGSATDNNAMIVSFAFIGFGAGNAQLAAFALPELLPNKWRPAAVVLADIGVFFAVVVGPVAGRFAIQHGNAWIWLFYAPAIAVVSTFRLVALWSTSRLCDSISAQILTSTTRLNSSPHSLAYSCTIIHQNIPVVYPSDKLQKTSTGADAHCSSLPQLSL